jgi:hypothetical protein
MNRNNWKFDYPAADLHMAASKKLDYHESRLKWWTKKQDEVMKAIKKTGLRIDQSIVMELAKTGYSTSNAGRGPSVQIDAKLLADMNECTNKIAEHKSQVKVYGSWVAVLEEATGDYSLEHDDWLFFFSEK